MQLLVFIGLLLLMLSPAVATAAVVSMPVRLNSVFSSGMVLQRQPRAARIFGTASPGATVSVLLAPQAIRVQTTAGADGRWLVALPPQPASKGNTLTIGEAGSSPGAKLNDLAFGDVFLCAGQSNMAVQLANRLMMNQSAELAAAHLYDIRLMNNGVMWPPIGTPPNQTWTHANASTTGAFSSLCWLVGRDIHRALGGAIAVGLVSSCVGGTGIEQWSAPTTLHKCAAHWPTGAAASPGNLTNCLNNPADIPSFEKKGPWCSTLWRQMIAPLAPMALSSILWYQGENNVCAAEWDGSTSSSCVAPLGASFYSCAMTALITDWRSQFQPAQFASAEPPLPFVFAELDGYAACKGRCVPPALPVCESCRPSSNFATLRAAQATAAAAAKATLVLNFDLGTLNSPAARIHSPRKAVLARRFGLQLERLVWGRAGTPVGPRLLNASASGSTVGLVFEAAVHLHGTAGCVGGDGSTGEPIVGFRCCDTSPFALLVAANGAPNSWVRHRANATTVSGSMVSLHTADQSVLGVRYSWEAYPNCGVYSGQAGGPVPGGASVYGGIAPGCQRKPRPNESWTGVPPDCVYIGDALPAAPFEIMLPSVNLN